MRLSTLYNQVDLLKQGHFSCLYFLFYFIFVFFLVMVITGFYFQYKCHKKSKDKIIAKILEKKTLSNKGKLNLSSTINSKKLSLSNSENDFKNDKKMFDFKSISSKFSEIIEDEKEHFKDNSEDDNNDINETLDEKFL